MEWVLGGLILALGFTLIIAGAQGTGEQLYSAVTGKTPAGSSKTSTTASAITTALNGAGVGTTVTPQSGTALGGGPPVLA